MKDKKSKADKNPMTTYADEVIWFCAADSEVHR